ncbi:hypothetical protein F0562_016730 [Nyssa sinensis]|uniref:Uncharacterized protein n=1 Tax=Nyssa sinensis TaxID=561372 RepID=A0A5J4ZGQ8_9ASTE|nr:hypothetical protein F0562_016730 [Nyssa sinensis]
MAQQEDGWPLGLQPLNVRVGLVRNRDVNGSVSFSTLLTGSPTSSTDSSSDLDTESTGSFFRDESITLGSLIGVSSILELSRRSIRGMSMNNAPSLGHFLEAERRAASIYRRNQSPTTYGPDDFSHVPPVSDPNSLFVSGHVAPPPSSSWSGFRW